jgi:hypothetical protein
MENGLMTLRAPSRLMIKRPEGFLDRACLVCKKLSLSGGKTADDRGFFF